MPPTLSLRSSDKQLCNIALGNEECTSATPSIFGNWVAAPMLDKAEARVLLIDLKVGKVRAEITLEKASAIAVRLQSEVLTVADNRGRLLAMDLNSGHLIRNLRI